MNNQEMTEAFKDLFQGWERLFSQIKHDHPDWSDERVADLTGKIITNKLFA